ncbi:MAG: TonB-dependent hemoglobin/transferrin/lactoferrin family receptor [Porticoccaceae bacterium]
MNSKCYNFRALSFALLVTTAASGAVAQTEAAAQVVLPKRSVTSTVMESTTENTQVVDSRQMEDDQVRNLDDLVRYIPGVDVDNIGRFGSSGFNIRGMDGDRVAITVDGLSLGETLNPPTYTAYDFFNSGRGGIDIDSMKAVEIIKGADSITAGSGALGGAVVFVTKDPADYLDATGNDTHVGVKTGYASGNEEFMATATLANRTGALETMLLYTARQGHETESYYSGSRPNIPGTAREIPDPLDYDNDNLLFKLHYHLDDNHRLGLVAERYESQSELDNQTRLNASYLTRTSDDRVERERYGVNYLWKAGNALFDELDWRYDYQKSYTLGHTRMTIPNGCPAGASSPALEPCLRTENRDYEQELHKTVLHLDKKVAGHRLGYGISWEEKSVDYADVKTRFVGTTSEIGVGWPQYGTDFVPQTDVRAWSVYARDQVSLVDDRLLLNAGVRFDRYEYSPSLDNANYGDSSGTVDDVSFSSPSWQLGASWNLTPHHVLWAQTGAGFRAPTVENMYLSPSTSIATEVASGQQVDLWNTVSNPDLEAEESFNVEAGYRWQGERHLLGISVYRNEYRNFIDYATFIRNPGVEYQTCSAGGAPCTSVFGDAYDMLDNIGKATVEGVELEGRWLFASNWSLRLAYSWNEGEEKDGTPLQSIVPASGVLGLAYTAPTDRWSVEARALYSEGKDLGDATRVDAATFTQIPIAYFEGDNDYTVVDLQARYDVTANLRLNIGVYNLFDEEYIRWQRIRFVDQGSAAGGARGGVSGDGIHRFTEPGRNYRLTLAYNF